MTKLDEIALNIELVLISIIEAVALTFLSENTVHALSLGDWMLVAPFALAGFAILLVFWAQAILHAVSFIRWPLRMEHMLLYFVAVFLQIIAYAHMDDILQWFWWWTAFSLVALVIYFIDLRIIRTSRVHFESTAGGKAYIEDVERRHLYEMKYLVPIALVFNIGAALVTFLIPRIFDHPYLVITLGILQFLVSLGALIDCIRNFKRRSAILPKLFESR